jgi:PAS domain S-box-containing protein
MSQGYAVYDGDQKLICYNQKFADLYGFPPGFLRPGMDFKEILRFRAERGDFGERDPKEQVQSRLAKRGTNITGLAGRRTLPNGKAIIRHRQPMPNGCTIITYTDITDLAKTERALRESEEKFRGAFDNAGVGIFIRSADGKDREYNRAFCEMLGYSEEELKSMQLRDIAHSDDDPETTSIRNVSFDDRGSCVVERRFIRKDGKTIWGNVSYKIIHDAEGNPLSTIAMCQDITERKEAERELDERGQYLAGIMQNAADGIITIDQHGIIETFTPAAELIFGYQAEEICGKNVNILMPEPDKGRHDGYIENYQRTGEGRIIGIGPREIIAQRKDGATFPMSLAVSSMEIGGKKKFIGIVRDITARKKLEWEATEKSHLLEATFESMVQGIAVYDADHTLITFNPQYAEILGLPSDYLHTGMNRLDLLRFQAEQGHYGETPLDATIEERLASATRRESSDRTLPSGRSYSYERKPMPNGGYIATVTDITERREAEKQLQQALKMEAVGQLTGGIAHDFNNLLAVSMGNVELAEEVAYEGGDVGPYLETIKRSSERGASLTNQLLAFSRKQTLFPQVIDAGELLGGIADLLRSSLGETIEVRVTSDDDLWPSEVDPHQLESAVLNLAINARDAMPGGGRLTIQTANISLDDDYAVA